MTGFWAVGFAFALLVAAAVVALGWPRMRPHEPPRVRTPQQEAGLMAALEEERRESRRTYYEYRERERAAAAAVRCPGPLIWYDADGPAVLLCAHCGYIVTTGNYNDEAHVQTSVMREGLAS